jgi:hypothetical protein
MGDMDKKNPGAVALGKLRMAKMTTEEKKEFASKGGTTRLKNMSKKARKELARKAAAARWGNR